MDKEYRTAIVVVVLAAAVYVAPVMIKGNVFSPAELRQLYDITQTDGLMRRGSFAYDAVSQFESWARVIRSGIEQGRIPLWNFYEGLGSSVLGNPQMAVLYPLNWPYLLGIGEWVWNIIIFLKLILAGLGMLYACGVIGVSGYSALIASVGFTYGGAIIAWMYWPIANILVLFPYMFVAATKLARIWSVKSLFALALVVMFSIFGGHPGTFFQGISVVVVYYLVYSTILRRSFKGVGKSLIFLGIAIFAGILLGFVQLAPFIENLAYTSAKGRLLGF